MENNIKDYLNGYNETLRETIEEYDNVNEWLHHQLDLKVITSLDGVEFYGAEVLITFGGPNVWIDTKRDVIRGSWAFESHEIPLDPDLSQKIHSEVKELHWFYL